MILGESFNPHVGDSYRHGLLLVIDCLYVFPRYPDLLAEGDQTCWVMVPPGLRRTVASVTNRPVDAERLTLRLFPVPAPTRSVVVVRGDRAAVALVTKRPVRALRLTDRAMVSSSEHSSEGEGAHSRAPVAPLESLVPLTMELAVLTSSCWGGPAGTGPPFFVSDLPTLSL